MSDIPTADEIYDGYVEDLYAQNIANLKFKFLDRTGLVGKFILKKIAEQEERLQRIEQYLLKQE